MAANDIPTRSQSEVNYIAGDGFLHRYFLNNGSRRLHKWVHYFDIYERHFERYRGKSPVVVEIGVMGGGSLEMWKAYFGSGSKIVGVDINPACKSHESANAEIFIGSQDNPKLIAEIVQKYPHIDIVIDDGSHRSPHMIGTFQLLYDHVGPNGVYLVEDTHANYWDNYDGGVKKPGSFMEFSKDKIDELNAVHTRGALTPNAFTKSTDSITFYDSVVVFEKRPQGFRQAPITNGMEFPRDR